MKSLCKFAACGLVLMSCVVAGAQVTKQGAAYLFRMRFKPGQTVRYSITTSGQVQGQAFTSSMAMTQKTLRVTGGVATVQASMGDATVRMGKGQPIKQPMPANVKNTTLQLDSRGRVSGAAGPQQTTVQLPERPIAVGATWTATSDVAAGQMGTMKATVTYKFVGVERLGAFTAAKIQTTARGTGQMSISGNGTTWLNMADGSLIKSTQKATMTMGQMKIPMTVTVSRK